VPQASNSLTIIASLAGIAHSVVQFKQSRGMAVNILESIKERMSSLPRTQKKAASYFYDNWEKVAYLSTSEVSAATGLSQATIVRATVSLGFGGFVDFQENLREFIQHRLSTVHRLDRSQKIIQAKTNSEQELLGSLFQKLMDNLDLTYRKLNAEELASAVKMISGARRVIVIGMRSSMAAANYLGFNLSMIRDNVLVVSSDHGVAEALAYLGEADVAISFSFPRYTKTAVRATKTARELGAGVISISDSSTSPIAELADIGFLAETNSPHFNHSLVAVIGLIDVLLFMLIRSRKEETRTQLANLEKQWESLGTFYKG
jgi:DNA-binding MurR/RpiR family transcriptional regulator